MHIALPQNNSWLNVICYAITSAELFPWNLLAANKGIERNVWQLPPSEIAWNRCLAKRKPYICRCQDLCQYFNCTPSWSMIVLNVTMVYLMWIDIRYNRFSQSLDSMVMKEPKQRDMNIWRWKMWKHNLKNFIFLYDKLSHQLMVFSIIMNAYSSHATVVYFF